MDSDILSRLELGAKARQDAELLASTLASVRQDNRELVARLTDREEHVKLLESKLTNLNVNLADLTKEQLVQSGRLEQETATAELIRKVSCAVEGRGGAGSVKRMVCIPTYLPACIPTCLPTYLPAYPICSSC